MVRNKVIYFMVCSLLLESSALALSHGFAVHWKGARDERCQRLVEAFLYELRSTVPEQPIELEATNGEPRGLANTDESTPRPRHLDVECDGQDQRRLKVNERHLRFLAKAGGFEATDWLAFQRAHLSPDDHEQPAEPISLAPVPKPSQEPAREPAQTISAEVGSGSIFKKWWFWALVGGAGAGIFAVTQLTKGSPSGGINVEIQ